MAGDELNRSDLASILRNPLVNRCVWWKDLGLELEIEKHVIDRIGQDFCEMTENCKRELIDWWLMNGLRPTWQKLYDAIARANSWHDSPGNEGRLATEAVDRLEKFLGNWDDENEKVVYKHDRFERELRYQEEWLSTLRSVDDENEEWKRTEAGIRRENIKQALELGSNYLASSFVKEFLRNKGITNFSYFNDQAIEGMLHRALMDTSIDRETQKMVPMYKEVKDHRKEIQGLQHKVDELKEQLVQRSTAYKKIKTFLENAHVNQEEIQKLRERIKITDDAIKRCERVKWKCNDYYNSVHANFQCRHNELDDFIQFLTKTIELMEKFQPQVTKAIHDAVRGAAVGAVVGAAVGTVVLPIPILGTVIGASLGAGMGAGVGWLVGHQDTSNRLTDKDAEREIRMYNNTVQRGLSERDRITALLAEKS